MTVMAAMLDSNYITKTAYLTGDQQGYPIPSCSPPPRSRQSGVGGVGCLDCPLLVALLQDGGGTNTGDPDWKYRMFLSAFGGQIEYL
ncbi:MAG: hypothetical protein MUC60_05510 [Oscillatoria sp. Prado101]|nr:hypothetical protein [Oscillatoria sp. Prado101]